MGMYGKSTRFWTVAVLGAVALIAVGSGLIAASASLSFGDIVDREDPGNGIDTVATDDYDVNAVFRLATDVSSAEAYMFKAQPDADNPVKHGNYVGFDIDEATSGLTEGDDYYKADLSNSNEAEFDNPDSGTYHAVLVDKSSPREYHYEFFSVEMPEQVEQFKVEQDQPVILARSDAFTRMAEYGDDEVLVLDSSGSVLTDATYDDAAGEYAFDDHTGTIEDRDRSVERTIEIDQGVAYLGELVTSSENLSNVHEIEATVEVNGAHAESEMLLDGSEEEFGSLELTDSMETEPLTSGDEVTVTIDVIYDAQESDSGENIVTFAVEDIYGNKIGDGDVTVKRGTGSAE